jgi:uroporphyrinogen-III synthase
MRVALDGRCIVLFESRLKDELAELVRRGGGIPVCVPAIVERQRASGHEVAALLDMIASGDSAPVFVFSTGVGARALFDEARSLGRAAELVEAIRRGGSICRGPKAVVALHREGLAATVKARSPFTTVELIEALASLDLTGHPVVLVHYGERNEPLVEALTSQGAVLLELLVYEWRMPEDTAPLTRAIESLIRGDFDAAAFTTQVQARHLMSLASRIGRRNQLVAALRSQVVVAAVGPTCARVLDELGVSPHVVPDPPKMGSMLEALAGRLAGRNAA